MDKENKGKNDEPGGRPAGDGDDSVSLADKCEEAILSADALIDRNNSSREESLGVKERRLPQDDSGEVEMVMPTMTTMQTDQEDKGEDRVPSEVPEGFYNTLAMPQLLPSSNTAPAQHSYPGAFAVEPGGGQHRIAPAVLSALEDEMHSAGQPRDESRLGLDIVHGTDVEIVGNSHQDILAESHTAVEVYEGTSVGPHIKRRKGSWMGLGLVILGAVAIVAGILRATSNRSSQADRSPAKNTTLIEYPVFRDYFPPRTIKTILNADPSNAYYHANKWMLNDPYLDSYTKDQHMQRLGSHVFQYEWCLLVPQRQLAGL